MKAKALQTIKRGSRWHIPGTPSEILDVSQKDLEKIGHAVEIMEPAELTEVKLPDDFPYRSILEAAGFATVESLLKVDDLTSLKGIGPKSAAAIEAALGGSD